MALFIQSRRQGIVFISDAGLRLQPGQVVEVDRFSPHMEKALAYGFIARVPHPDSHRQMLEITGVGDEVEAEQVPQEPSSFDEEAAGSHECECRREDDVHDSVGIQNTWGSNAGNPVPLWIQRRVWAGWPEAGGQARSPPDLVSAARPPPWMECGSSKVIRFLIRVVM